MCKLGYELNKIKLNRNPLNQLRIPQFYCTCLVGSFKTLCCTMQRRHLTLDQINRAVSGEQNFTDRFWTG